MVTGRGRAERWRQWGDAGSEFRAVLIHSHPRTALLHRMRTRVNNSVQHSGNLQKVDFKCSHHTKKSNDVRRGHIHELNSSHHFTVYPMSYPLNRYNFLKNFHWFKKKKKTACKEAAKFQGAAKGRGTSNGTVSIGIP